jgi:hypothetical protein
MLDCLIAKSFADCHPPNIIFRIFWPSESEIPERKDEMRHSELISQIFEVSRNLTFCPRSK